jgi:hypothetical protein
MVNSYLGCAFAGQFHFPILLILFILSKLLLILRRLLFHFGAAPRLQPRIHAIL